MDTSAGGFSLFADFFDEGLLVVTRAGIIVELNRAARTMFPTLGTLSQRQNFADLVLEPAEELASYFGSCARTTRPLPKILTVVAATGSQTVHCDGARLRAPSSEGLLMLRLVAKEQSVVRFVALNQRLEKLKVEMAKRLHAERALDEQRELLSVTLASIGDAVITTDTTGAISFMNAVAERSTGRQLASTAGKPLEEVFVIQNEDTGLPVENPVRGVLATGTIISISNHTLLVRSDGSKVPIEDTAAPIRNVAGKVLGAVLIFREVSEQRQLQHELASQALALRKLDKQKDEFLAMLGHELRNPLAPLHNAIQLMRMRATQKPDLIDLMERQVHQLTRLIGDLLDVSRITRGTIPLTIEPIDLAEIIRHSVEAIQLSAECRDHEIDLELPAEPLAVMADPVRMTQVFNNLINNAAKFMEPPGTITITAAKKNGEVVARIRDEGAGIEAESLAEIFEPFHQSDRRYHRHLGGLGIGLTLVKMIVERHDGRIEAMSEGVGKGSEFRLSLPSSARQAGSPASDSPRAEGTMSGRVLIVDDNRDVADSLAALARSWGLDVRVTHDGPSALDASLAFAPTLVMLDIGLPGMSGFDVARELRQSEHPPKHIVALTGYTMEAYRQRSEAAGIDEHLAKPVEADRFRELLMDYLSESRQP